MYQDWSINEVVHTIQDYFDMFRLELQGEKYNKSVHRRNLVVLLNGRNEGAIEFKHQNISAVLANMGLPFIRGYKPLGNYQQILEEEVAHFLQSHRDIFEPKFERFSNTLNAELKKPVDFETFLGLEPEASEFQEKEPTYRPIKTNYLEKEQNNRKIGERGEELVIQYEKFRLQKAGKESLAENIEWVSMERGDGAGYDILSKNFDGTDRYIEVKTTKLSKETPIYLTKTEVNFALLRSKDFYLYRVYSIDSKPQLFIKSGQYENFCKLQAQTFKGYF